MLLSVIYYLSAFLAFLLSSIYYIHMFQLNGYHRDGHMRWHNDILGAIFAKETVPFIALILSFFKNDTILAICCILNLITAYVFLPAKAKKPLVFTSRIKRLIFTLIMLFAITVAVSVKFKYAFFVTSLAVLLSNFLVLLSDIINSPFEKAVKKHYINDAKKKLSSHKNLTVIGITGSYGKTSTKYFLTKLLSSKYNVLMTPASYNTPMGVVKTVRENLKPTTEVFICEMGAKNIGDIKEICDIVHPSIGIITSVGPQHLESFKTIENVVKTKFELCDSLPGDGKAYLNYDNEYIKNKEIDKKVVSYGIENENVNSFAENITLSESGTDFDIKYCGKTIHFSTKLLGSHNVQNLAGCIALALDMGVDEHDAVLAVKRLESVPHRLQIIDGGSITIIDDAFNANPGGTRAALEVLSSFDGTKIIVTPGMIELGDKQKELNFDFGVRCTKVCDYILLVGGRIADDVYEGASSCGFDENRLLRFEKVEQAVEFSRTLTSEKRKFVLLENDLPDNY